MDQLKNIIEKDLQNFNILSSLDNTYIFTDQVKHEYNVQNILKNQNLGIISGTIVDKDSYIFNNNLTYNIYYIRKNFDSFKNILQTLFKNFEPIITENPISCYPFTKIVPLASGFISLKIPKN
jgi:hypothetical protein